jgi:uncharacterized protein (TIGR01777 family)
MKIIVAGGTGQVGRVLTRAFRDSGTEVVVLSRQEKPGVVFWDGKSPGAWQRELSGADAVINLAGRSVNCRYHTRNRREILESRVNSVRALGTALANVENPPPVWLQASTATIYAHRFDQPNDERNGIIGGSEKDAPDTWRFSIDVAQAWETAVADAGPLPRTRIVVMRSAMIMSPDRGGIFAHLLGVVRFGLGGATDSGQQYMSWIHESDFVRAVRFLIENENLSGAVNICSPNPLPNSEFMHELRRAWGMKFGLPVRKWMLEIGTFLMRSESELILKSRRVVPRRLLDSGFQFQFPTWQAAAVDLCRRYRETKKKPGSR